MQSHWFGVHVVLSFLGYAAFTIAFVGGIIQLISKSYNLDNLNSLLHSLVGLGVFIFSAGIMSGSVWASYAWGRCWAWDPKEVWTLVTLIVYIFYLYIRSLPKVDYKKSASCLILGFIFMMFTFFGISLLKGGMHKCAM